MTEHTLDLKALAKAMQDGAHSIFSASGSHLWFNCAGGLIPNLLAPDSSGREAAEGTVAHFVGETWLSTGKRPKHLVNTTMTVSKDDETFDIEITYEMLNHVQRYVDWCWSTPGAHYVETKVYYDDLTPIPKQGGTCDHAACAYQRLVVTDLKYGKGVFVHVEHNPQLLLYAYGFFREWDWLYDFQEIVIRVAQPRMQNMEEWVITRAELLAFAESVKPRAKLAWTHNAPRTPGEKQCTFCGVKGTCGAYVKYMRDMLEADPVYAEFNQPVTADEIVEVKDQIDWMRPFKMKPVAELTIDQLSVLYQWRSSIESWWKAAGAELVKRMAAGENPPLQKLVEARSRRVFPNAERTVEHFAKLGIKREEIIQEKVVTPAEMERVLMKHEYSSAELPDLLAPVVFKPPGKPTLAPMSDKRPALRTVDDAVYREFVKPETSETEEP